MYMDNQGPDRLCAMRRADQVFIVHQQTIDYKMNYLNQVKTGPRSAVGNMSDCWSRVANSIPAQSHTFGDWSWNNFYSHSLPFHWFKKACCQLQTKVNVDRLVKLAQEKVWLGELTVSTSP